MEGPLLAIEHGKDVKVQGITFEYGRHIGVYMENTHRALIKNCIIRNMGGVGVSIGKGTLKAGNQRGHESGGNPASRVVGDLMERFIRTSCSTAKEERKTESWIVIFIM